MGQSLNPVSVNTDNIVKNYRTQFNQGKHTAQLIFIAQCYGHV